MKIKRNGLTKKEIKELVTKEVEALNIEEQMKEKVIIYPVFVKEYYKSDYFNKNFKLATLKQKLFLITMPFNSYGANISYNDTYIFLIKHNITNIIDKISLKGPHQLVDLLRTVYHEFGHKYQEQKRNKYSSFDYLCITGIENFIKQENKNFYLKYHNYFLKEIDADLFSITKIEEYLKKNNIYNEEKQYVEELRKKIIKQKENYDFDLIWEEFYSLCKKNKSLIQTQPLIDIFFQPKTFQYKNITEICQNKRINLIDIETLYRIITSESYLNQLDLKKLLPEEINILKGAIKEILGITKKDKKLKHLSNILSEIELIQNEQLITINSTKRHV